ncbi:MULTISPECIES: ATP-binding protein [unclassified Corynebacterium]|jgi:ATPase|uniref:ATP-binding protein n=3 Tax=Corynebacterium TaxID=1716 RepID=UPI001EF70C0E|nr:MULTISPECIES: ATP-binding protein [unclassified Corynebacterium]MCG7243765.1 AAA family ATPase [Corynebacterium sp. ACRPS]MDK8474879.1 ATP-binding protein [Corynebacterium sp. MSK078]MDK8660082.1 ATP-binding protein [Corynebacterium sp. MSK204]
MTNLYPGQFRISRIQLINWGTFHGYFSIPVARKGFLITGGSGSGKSTLLDAMSAVLVPQKDLKFNAASQQDLGRHNGRTLVSYIRGAWRQQENAHTGEIAPEYLREGATNSVVALTYDNGAGTQHTLIAIFRLNGGENSVSQIKRLYGVVQGDEDIDKLSPLLTRSLDTRKIKAMYKGPGASFTPTYTTFADRFRKRLGIKSEQGQVLLHRTQSAKSLSSLDQLFRDYMLDTPSTFERAEESVEQFEDLRQAYLRVEDVKAQIETLAPLPQLHSQRTTAEADKHKAEAMNEALPAVRARLVAEELDYRIRALTAQQAEAHSAAEALEAEVTHLDDAERRAAVAVSQLSAGELAALEAKIETAEKEIEHRSKEFHHLAAAADQWTDHFELNPHGFAELQANAHLRIADFEADSAQLTEQQQEAGVAARDAATASASLESELHSFSSRRTNIDKALVELRTQLARDTGYAESELPFAGELLDIAPQQAEWEPVIQKLLHGFAATLLVPETAREAINQWVNSRNVGTRLEYRTIPEFAPAPAPARSPQQLIHKLEFQDHPMAQWVRHHISSRFNYECVNSVAALEQVTKTPAVTRDGLESRPKDKDGSTRFIKDDRTRFTGTRWYRVGSTNTAKIELLRSQLAEAKATARAMAKQVHELNRKMDILRTQRDKAQRVLETKFQDIDTASAEARKRDLQEQYDSLASSPEAQALATAHEQAKEKLTAARAQLNEAQKHLGNVEGELNRSTQRRQSIGTVPTVADQGIAKAVEEALHKGRRKLTIDDIDARRDEVQASLQETARRAARRIEETNAKIVSVLHKYLSQWPAEAADLEPQASFAGEGMEKLKFLRADRLADFRAQFLELLNGTTVQNLSHLASSLRHARSDIEQRMEFINKSLERTPFNGDRTLRIDVKDARGQVVQDFQRDLDAATSHSLAEISADEPEAAVARYHALDKILSRLGSSEPEDIRWRNLVLDTRKHVSFIGRECYPDGTTANTYQDSASLSGGQAQKLVFFCLAAALRFRLAEPDQDVPTYGSIILDEAFDRADPAFTRTAMSVFASFGFHMILATPFKLIQTLSPYVDGTIVVNYDEPIIQGRPQARTGYSLIDATSYSQESPESTDADA